MNAVTMPVDRYNKIKKILERVIHRGRPADWKVDIVSAIASEIDIKNWMHVRSVLQELIEAGKVSRTQNIHEEVYMRIAD